MTKKALKQKAQSILRAYSVGQRLSDSDAEFIYCLLQQHYNAQEKIGPGVVAFEVMAATCGTNCFAAVRADGTRAPFSYLSCFRPPTPLELRDSALRRAISEQIVRFRGAADEHHVHHVIPFAELVLLWWETAPEELRTVAEVRPCEPVGWELHPVALRAHWCAFHAKHARMVVLSPEAHKAAHR